MVAANPRPAPAPEIAARPPRRGLFLADWRDAVFVHFAVPPRDLAPSIPFDLDLFGGEAFVSLVAFTQRNLRPRFGGRLAARLSRPLATHPFLNLRTYVRRAGEPGIFFLAEWIPNRLAALLGPVLYGLPYRLGRLDYRHAGGAFRGRIASLDRRDALEFQGASRSFATPARDALDRFLVERYTAYTRHGRTARRFRIAHAPWPVAAADVAARDAGLLREFAPWLCRARPAGAHSSPGVFDVSIGPPELLPAARRAVVPDAANTPHAEAEAESVDAELRGAEFPDAGFRSAAGGSRPPSNIHPAYAPV